MRTEREEGNVVRTPDVPARIHLLGAVLGVSAFMVLLWPLGLDGAVRFMVAMVLGSAVGVMLGRYGWGSTQ